MMFLIKLLGAIVAISVELHVLWPALAAVLLFVPLTIAKANFSASLTHTEQSVAYGWLRSYYFPLYVYQSSLRRWIDIGGTASNPFCVCSRFKSHSLPSPQATPSEQAVEAERDEEVGMKR